MEEKGKKETERGSRSRSTVGNYDWPPLTRLVVSVSGLSCGQWATVAEERC